MSTTASPPAARRTQPGSGAPPAVSVEHASKRFRLLKDYPSRMAGRLGFAVAVQMDADVLLVDEGLAVGDASFVFREAPKVAENL